MTIFFYIPVTNETSRQFVLELETVVPKKDRKIFQTIEEFSRMLIRSSDNRRIAVILLPSRQDLLSLLTIRDLLLDIRLILILPDREEKTFSLGLKLFPSFISYTDNGANDTCAVLKKIQTITNSHA